MKLNRIKRRTSNSLILELTPLIDVVFLLLIFFMVATTFEDVSTSIKIDLPISSLKSEKSSNEIKISITKTEDYFISYKTKSETKRIKVKRNELKNKLKTILENSTDKNIIISADKNISHGVIVDVMTKSKEAGAISLDIDTAFQKK